MKRFIIFCLIAFTLTIVHTNVAFASVVPTDTQEQFDKSKDKVKEKIDQGVDVTKKVTGNIKEEVVEKIYWYHGVLKNAFAFLFIGSISLGALVAMLAKKNKGLRKRVIILFGLIIPFFLLLQVYCIPYLMPAGDYAIKTVKQQQGKMETVEDTTSSKETKDVYYDLKSRMTKEESEEYHVWDDYDHLRRLLKNNLISIILGCEVLGLVIIRLAKRDRALKQWAGVSICVIVPLIILAIVYLIPMIEKIFK